MASLVFKKADRSSAKLKIALGGPSGTGKTMSSLLMAYGMLAEAHKDWSPDEIWEHICIIDTENGSGSLYIETQVGTQLIGVYNTIEISPPFTVDRYIDAIHIAEQNAQEVIIVDSLSHAWSGEGGALDKHGKITQRVGNSYTAWREPKEDQNKLMNTILQSRSHFICNIRAKTEYVQEKDDKGKTTVRNIGMGLITQGESQYEYTVLFMLDRDHVVNAEKDRTGMFAGKYFTITTDTGRQLYNWLLTSKNIAASIVQPVAPQAEAEEPQVETPAVAEAVAQAEPQDKELLAKVDAAIKAYIKQNGRGAVVDLLKATVGNNLNYMTYDNATLAKVLSVVEAK